MEVIAIGGYNEFGRNMTLLKVGDESIIIDMGIRLDRVMIHEDTDISKMQNKELVEKGIIPDDSTVDGKVKAVVITHGHLDHLGAVTKLAPKYNVPVIGTPYTIELIKSEKRYVKNFPLEGRLEKLEPGKMMQISPKITIEFVRVTHSIPHTAMLAVHTPDGTALYANDFKFDDSPVVGEPSDYNRLRELGKNGVRCLIVETTRVEAEQRTPSEKIVNRMLLDNLARSAEDKGIIVSTFSSHIARISSIADIAQMIGRKPVLLGRSMAKYSGIAEEIGIFNLPKDTGVYGVPKSVEKVLKEIKNKREEYLMVVTGHQGEPDAMLARIANKKVPFTIAKDDEVVFSANTIPNPLNFANRYSLETKLKMQGARLVKDVHVSGHAGKEDHRDLLKMLNPDNIIPCHGTLEMLSSYAEMAESTGYALNRDLFLIRNGQRLEV